MQMRNTYGLVLVVDYLALNILEESWAPNIS